MGFTKEHYAWIAQQASHYDNNTEAGTGIGVHRSTVAKAKQMQYAGELNGVEPLSPFEQPVPQLEEVAPEKIITVLQEQATAQTRFIELLAHFQGDQSHNIFELAATMGKKPSEVLALCEEAEAADLLSSPNEGVFRARYVQPITVGRSGNNLSLSYKATGSIPSADDLLRMAELEPHDWQLIRYKPNTWQMAGKGEGGGMEVVTLVQAKAEFQRKVLEPFELQPVAPVEVHITAPTIIKAANISNLKRAIVIPDIQCGFKREDQLTGRLTSLHDREAMDVALQLIIDAKPDVVVFNGDNLDNPGVSEKWPRLPEFYLTMQPSIVELAWFYAQIRSAIGKDAEMHWIEGNHEARIQKLLKINYADAYQIRPANEIDHFPLVSVERMIGTEKLGITYHGPYPHGEYWLNSRFGIIHGERVNGKSGGTSSAVVQDTQHGVSFGHVHRRECATKTFWQGNDWRIDEAWSFGTLAKLNRGIVPGFKSQQNWQQGVGDIWFETRGHEDYNVSSIAIDKGAAIYNGKKYLARPEVEIIKHIESDTRYNVRYGHLEEALAA